MSFLSHNVTPTFAPPEIQSELIKLQNNDTLKAMYPNKLLLELQYIVFKYQERVSKLESSRSQMVITFWKHVLMQTILF